MRLCTNNATPLSVTIDAEQVTIQNVGQFCYLGSIISTNGGTDEDVRSRIAKARVAFNKLQKIWSMRNISRITKIRIFNSCVKSVLLYGSETWKVSDKITKQLQVFVNSCLKKICRIFWPLVISNEHLWQLTKSKEISKEVLQRKWRWIGHTLRKPPNDIARMAFEYEPQGSRQRGRPKNTWKRSVLLESQKFGSWNTVKKIAKDRNQWKIFTSALCSG